DPTACGPNQTCQDGAGCVCNPNVCNGTSGDFCNDDNSGTITCGPSDDDGCIIVTGTGACADPTVCQETSPTAGDAECVCPAVGTEENTGCQGSPINFTQCSADKSDVITCTQVGACPVWKSDDDCVGDGLVCDDNDCVCPDVTNTNEFYANPVVDRSARPPESITP